MRPDLPGRFVRVVERALERDPARRYRSSGAMQQDLVSALELESPSEASESVIPTRQMTGTSSIAVLPFVNLGPDRDIEYFCNGLAEELLHRAGQGRPPCGLAHIGISCRPDGDGHS